MDGATGQIAALSSRIRSERSEQSNTASNQTGDVRAAGLQEEMAAQRFSVPPDPTKTAATERTSQRAERAIKEAMFAPPGCRRRWRHNAFPFRQVRRRRRQQSGHRSERASNQTAPVFSSTTSNSLTMRLAISKEAVAAGDGAFSTCTWRGARW